MLRTLFSFILQATSLILDTKNNPYTGLSSCAIAMCTYFGKRFSNENMEFTIWRYLNCCCKRHFWRNRIYQTIKIYRPRASKPLKSFIQKINVRPVKRFRTHVLLSTQSTIWFNFELVGIFGYIVMLRARMFRSLIPVLMIKERNIRARNITI